MKYPFLVLLLFLANSAISQPFKWGKDFGVFGDNSPVDIDKVDDGFIFTTTHNQYYSQLYKFDLNGNMIWDFNFVQNRQYDLLATCLDGNENVYTILSINENETLGMIDNIPIYPGVSLLKLNKNGQVLWSRKIGGSTVGNNIFYFNGEIFLTGIFGGTISFENQKTLTSKEYYQCFMWMNMQGEDFYCAKFDTIGTFKNAISFGDDYPDFIGASTIDSKKGDIYISGGTYGIGCITPYTNLIKIKTNLSIEYNNTISRGISIFNPTNIYYSSNDNIYLWGYNQDIVTGTNFILDSPNDGSKTADLLEYKSSDGSYLKSKQFATKTNNVDMGTIKNNKAYLADYGTDSLLIYASSRNYLKFDKGTFTPSNETSKYSETLNNENLLLFKIDKKSFNTSYVASFKGAVTGNECGLDNPGPSFLDSCYFYFSATYKESPIEIFDNPIKNNTINGSDNLLLCKIDISKITPEYPRAGICKDEYQALVDFYNESGGKNWLHQDNWMDTIKSNVDNWYGVSVKEGHVFSIVMGNNNLTKIPEAIKRFPYLENVTFYAGGLSGAIPNLENCSNLKWMDLSENNYYYQDLEKVTQWKNYDQIYMTYFPQNVTNTIEIDTTIHAGDTIALKIPHYTPIEGDQYFWTRVSTYDYPYSIQNAKIEDEGTYVLVLRHLALQLINATRVIFRLHVENPQSISNFHKYEIRVSPNPTKNNLTILCDDPIERLQLFDNVGQLLIDKENIKSNDVYLNDFKNGIYFIKVQIRNSLSSFTQKIILQR
jgi:hypothetical protein